jgi:hypothetical protein
MLYLVLLLVVASLGLLIAALTTANTLWAWISVLISVAAAGLLVMDWVRTRRRRSQATPAADRAREPVQPPFERRGESPREPVGPAISRIDLQPVPDVETTAVTEPEPPADPVRVPPVTDGPSDPNVEPAEENTDATDRLVVSELTDEVVVIDERPRYHLATCGWLGDRPTMPLPVSEARELGFTPCARCAPDSTLAARHRADQHRH